MTTFITALDPAPGPGPRLAVKDLIDVEGVPTTAGSRPVAEYAGPAARDAPCLAGARAAGARLVGKANLYELAYGTTGINEWAGTPVNPLDPTRLPGGSSSGSAVAVGAGEADIAYGSDTGGSIRIPSAFCGTAGLKTTHGRIPLEGVWPLAPSLDTVGPMARDVAGLVLGMQMLEPGFSLSDPGARAGAPTAGRASVIRLRIPTVDVDPLIDDAVDRAVDAAELAVEEVILPDWNDAFLACRTLLDWEAARSNISLTSDPDRAAKLGPVVAERLRGASLVTDAEAGAARAHGRRWAIQLEGLLARAHALALPSVAFFPPKLDDLSHPFNALTSPVNLSGLPALSLPIPTGGQLPAGLQLIGPSMGEEQLLVLGRQVEAAVSRA